MKKPLVFSICLLFCIYSCKKDKPTVQSTPGITGSYTGTMHHLRTQFYGADTLIDTTYSYVLQVATDSSSTSNSNSLWMDGIEMDVNSNYAVHMNPYWAFAHPRQAASGQFLLGPVHVDLHFTHSDSWQGVGDVYGFSGTK